MLNVGGEVKYIPHAAHALEFDANGECPWVISYTDFNGKVEILEGNRIKEVLSAIKRYPDPAAERKKLGFVRPRIAWPANIRNVNEDGTVDIDVKSLSNEGVTLHYDHIPFNDEHAPHTCYMIGGN